MKAKCRLFMLMLSATLLSLVLLSTALVFLSCNEPPLTLGGRLDMYPPELALSRPDFMENVKDTVVIAGAVDDDTEVALLTVTIEGIDRQWKNESGKWQTRENKSSAWQDCDGAWDALGQGKYLFSLAVSLEGAEEGEYLVTVSAEDRFKNTGASAIKQRPVVLVLSPPAVRILSPVLAEGTSEDASAVFDNYQLKDPAALDRLLNVNIKAQWEITANSAVNSLEITLADNDGLYFTKTIESPPRNGSIVISEDEIVTENGKLADKKYLQIISRAKDIAGNDQSYSHGWFVYWPDADRPWIEGAGDEISADNFQVYPGSEVQARTYDDDGVGRVSYNIYSADSHVPLEGYPRLLENKPVIEGASPSTFFGWKFAAPEESGKYRITADVWDVSGTIGGTFIGFFTVMDSSAPSVTVTSPSPDETLFGDRWGTFTFTGIAGDGVNPAQLRLAWLNPSGSITASLASYRSSGYAGWDVELPASGTDRSGDNYWEDSDGNIVWDISLGEARTTASGRVERAFGKRINLFSDLGIGTTNPLEAQSFVLRVTGDSDRAVTAVHFTRGDLLPPDLSILKLTLERGGVSTLYDLEEALSLAIGDKLYFWGTWADDSFSAWNDTGKMGNFDVTYNGETLATALLSDGTWKAGPLEISEMEQLSAGTYQIWASLADIGGNVTERIASVRLEGSGPRLVQISCDQGNGFYRLGSEFDIYMEFSKEVDFSGGSLLPVLILNNGGTAFYESGNGGRKVYFKYTALDGDDTDATALKRLNVAGIVSNGNAWAGQGGAALLDIPKSAATGIEMNLGYIRDIRIFTKAPKLISVGRLGFDSSGSYTSDYMKEGDSVMLRADFDKDIVYTRSPEGNDAELRLNVGETGTHGVEPFLLGARTLIFTYTVQAGQFNSVPCYVQGAFSKRLGAVFLELNGSVIADDAGNEFDPYVTSKVGDGSDIYIFNNESLAYTYVIATPPAAPLLELYSDQTPLYKSIIITRQPQPEDSDSVRDGVLHYQIKTGDVSANIDYGEWENGEWNNYSENTSVQRPRISGAGTYTVLARVTDGAGQVAYSQPLVVTNVVPSGPLVFGWSANPGNYSAGDTVTITLVLREAAVVTGPLRLTLNVRNNTGGVFGRYGEFDETSNGTNRLRFTYTVQAGDFLTDGASYLEVTAVNQNNTILKRPGTDIVLNAGGELLPAIPLSVYAAIGIN